MCNHEREWVSSECVLRSWGHRLSLVAVCSELAPEELLNESCVGGGPGLPVHSLVAPQASRVLVGAQTHAEGKQQASPVSC